MKTISVKSIDQIKVDGFNLVVKTDSGESVVHENALIDMAKGTFAVTSDGKPLNVAEIVSASNTALKSIENVFVEDAIANQNKSQSADSKTADAPKEDNVEKARKDILEKELQKLEALKKEIIEKEKRIEEKDKQVQAKEEAAQKRESKGNPSADTDVESQLEKILDANTRITNQNQPNNQKAQQTNPPVEAGRKTPLLPKVEEGVKASSAGAPALPLKNSEAPPIDPITITMALDANSDSGELGDFITNVKTGLTFNGTTSADATVDVTINGQVISVVAGSGGTWRAVFPGSLPDGTYDVLAVAKNAQGGTATTTQTLVIDTIPPETPTVRLDAASDSGVSNQDAITNVNKPKFVGISEPNSTIELTLAGRKLTAKANAQGDWEILVTNELADATYTYSVIAKDAAGNSSQPLSAQIVVDTQAILTGGIDADSDTGRYRNDGNTKVTMPVFSGSSEKGAEIELSINGIKYNAQANDDGSWRIPTTQNLADGRYNYTISASDIAGNLKTISSTVVIDTINPPLTVGLASASDTGASNTDKITNANKPVIEGTTEAEAEVLVRINSKEYTVIADSTGKWSVTVVHALPDGQHNYEVIATDLAGNQTTVSDSLLVDTVMNLTGVLNSALDSGSSNSDQITNKTQLAFSGNAEPNAVVTLDINSQHYNAEVNSVGNWTLAIPTEFAQGTYNYTITGTDVAGNTKQINSRVVVDTETFVTVALSEVSDSGKSAADKLTNVNKPVFEGTGEAGSSLVLEVNNKTYSTTVSASGKWSIEVTDAIPDGVHIFRATATDVAGNTASASGSVTIDTQAPAFDGGLTAASDTGVSSSDKITMNNKPVFAGTGEANADVTLVIAGQTYTTTINAAGAWEIPVTNSIPDGTQNYLLTAKDAAGNATVLNGTVVIDTVALLTGRLDAAFDSGRSNSDNLTKFTQPKFSGTGEAGATVSVTIGGNTYQDTVSSAGTWSIAVTNSLAEDVHSYQIRTKDIAGNEASLSGSITVDTTAPTPFTGGLDAASDSGKSITDKITKINKPEFSGSVEPGATVILTIAGASYNAEVDAQGLWKAAVTATLADGVQSYTLVATDLAGNTSTLTGDITIDTIALLTGGLDVASDTGLFNNDGYTKDNRPYFSGTAEAGSTISLQIGGSSYQTLVAENGRWRIEDVATLTDGQHNYTLTALDIAGNTAQKTGDITVDTVTTVTAGLSTISDSGDSVSDNLTNVVRPFFNGTGEVGAEIRLDINNKSYTTQVGADGKWSVQVTDNLPNAQLPYTVTATDKAGNTATASGNITVDTIAPSLTGGLSAASDTGASNSDGLTKETRPLFSGTGEVGAKVSLTIAGTTYTTEVDPNGNWSVQVASSLTDGIKPYTITATDAAGNLTTLTGQITVDTVAELTGRLDAAFDSGRSNSDNITKLTQPKFTGTGEVGAAVSLTVNGVTYPSVVDTNGNWSIEVAMPEGMHGYQIRTTDLAGNQASLSGNITVDTTAPTPFTGGLDADSDKGLLNSDNITNVIRPMFSGMVETGNTVVLTIAGRNYEAIVDGSGRWTAEVTTGLADGNQAYTLKATDTAGNEAVRTGTVVVDTSAFVTGGLAADSDTGISNTDSITKNTTPFFAGTGEANASVKVNIAGQNYVTTVSSDGTWRVQVTNALIPDSNYNYTITSTDLAGNIASRSGNITVDTITTLSARLEAQSDSGESNSDNITNVVRPVFSGTGEVGAKVVVTINSKSYETEIGSNGSWVITVTDALPEAVHNYTVVATDIAGNTQTRLGSVTIDTSSPVFAGGLSSASDTGKFNVDGVTNNSTPIFSGTGEIGTKISLVINNFRYATEVQADGTWTIQIPANQPLPDGTRNYSLTATDVAGNVSTLTGSVVIDTQTLDVSGGLSSISDSGISNTDKLTKVATPFFNGTAEAYSDVVLQIDGVSYTTAADASGNWSTQVTRALNDGSYAYTITATDLAGNASSVNGAITIDTTAPTPFTARLDSLSDTGISNNDKLTKDSIPTISGTGENDTRVTVTIGGKSYSTVVSAGIWSITSEQLAQGSYTFTATAEDAAGNVTSTITDTIIIDTETFVTGRLTADTDSGSSNSDNLTNIPQPRFSGTTEVGNTVTVNIDGNNYAAIVDDQGNWSAVVTNSLADNSYNYTITALDKAGNTASSTGTVIVDTLAPVLTGSLDVSSDSAARDNITNDNTPTFSGTGENGAVVTLKIGGQQHTTTIVNGIWSLTVNTLSDGVKEYEIFATDSAGNKSSSITGSITVDTVTTVSGALDAGSDSGFSNSDGVTKFPMPNFSGTTEVGATVVVRINNVNYTANVDGNGNWTAAVTNALPEGQHAYTITATDVAGNTATAAGNITVDLTAPEPFTGRLAVASDTGTSNSDNLTNDTTPTFVGMGEVGARITLNINNQNYTTTVAADGSWTVTPSAPLPVDGVYDYTLTAMDLAGNTRELTGSITLDTVAVLTGGLDSTSDTGRSQIDKITNDTTPTFSGNAEPGSVVTLSINNKTYQATVLNNGSWTVTVTDVLPEGTYDYTINAKDIAGNQATQLTGNISVDITAPTPFTGGLDNASNSGITTDNITNDNTPTFSGTVEANSVVALVINNQTYPATVTGTTWSITAPQLTDGTYNYVLRATDVAGNIVELNQSIIIDTAPPPITGSLSASSDSGVSNSDKLTNKTNPDFNGTTQPGAAVVLTIGNNSYNATVDAAGNWTAKVTNALLEGTQSYTITATDTAGNTASISDSIVIDTTAPTPFTARLDGISDTGSSNSDKITKQTLPKITGTGENGALVTVDVSGQNYETTVSGSVWSITVQTPLSDGNHSFTAVAKDAAGNTTAPITDTFKVDTSTFVTGGIDASTDSFGNGIGSNSDGLTNVKQPKFVGTAEAGASIVLTIDGSSYTATADTDGNWSVDVTSNLLEGVQPYTIKATDIAGNQATKTGSITIDTSAPSVAGGLDVSSNSGLTTDNITKDKTPTFSGTGETGSLVRLSIGGQQHTALIENGIWSITVNDLSDGLKDYRITATDAAGNTSAPIIGEVVIDTTTSVTARLDAGSDTGFSNSDGITKNQTPTFSGTAEVGSSLVLTINGKDYTTTANSFGNWSVRVTDPLAENTLAVPGYSYSVTSTDIAGNTATASGMIKVDLTPPDPFTGRLDVASDSGSNNSDGITSDATPTFSGTGEANARVTLTINNQNYSTSVGLDGTWNVTPTVALPINGQYGYTLTAEDLAGNTTRQLTGNITLDTVSILSGGLDSTSDTGVSQTDGLTNDTRPYFSGGAEAGSVVTVSINNKNYQTTALADGSWKVRVTDVLPQSDYTYTINALDVAGNSATPITGSITVDTTAPTPFTGGLEAASNTGLPTDNVTKDKTPTFVGTVEFGATVVLFINNQNYPATVTGSNWTVTAPELVDGSYDYVLRATDAAGNLVELNQTVVIDTTPPAIAGSLSAESDSGSSNNDKLTNVTRPKFNGTTEPGASVVLNIGGNNYTASVDVNGNWTVNDTNALTEGTQNYTITATDVAGNTASVSSSIIVDLSAPSPFTARLDALSDTGFSNVDKYTKDDTPTISGTGENGSVVTVTVSGQTKTTTVSGGVWSVNLDTLAPGVHHFSAVAKDAAGNDTQAINDSFTVDIATTVSGGLDNISDSFGIGIGNNTDRITNIKQPWFRGTTEVGNKVDLTIGGNTYNASVDSSGNWEVQVTQDLSDGSKPYTINATDKAGNTESISGNIMVDTQEPTPFTGRLAADSDLGTSNSDGITKDQTPSFSGTGENGVRVKLVVAGTEYFTNIIDNAWTITLPELSDGVKSYSITATDTAGNTTTPITGSITIDSQISVAGQLKTDDDSGIKGDNKTNVTTPVFVGSGTSGDLITLTINDKSYSTSVGLNGLWSVRVTDAIVESSTPYGYTITALDAAGNTTSVSGLLTVDTSTVVTGGLDSSSDSNVNTDGVTNDNTPLFSGGGEPNSSVVININGANYTTTVANNGTWTLQLPVSLLDGVYPYTITATDQAGNTNSLNKSLTVDTVINLNSRLDALSDSGKNNTDGVTNDNTPTISGTGEANAVVTLSLNGKTYNKVVEANDTWAITLPDEDALVDNTYSYTAVITDLAGNTLTQTKSITIDTVNPTPFSGGLKAASDTGKFNSDGITRITTPIYSGKGEPQADVKLTINNKTYVSVVDANGDWTIEVTDVLPNASHDYVLTQTDLAGNFRTLTGTTVVDTQSPAFDGGLDASSDSGRSNSDGRTNDKSPLFSGTGEPNADVTLNIGGNNYFTKVQPDGTWSYQLPINLTDGVYNYRLTATDTAGNETIINKTMVVNTVSSLTGGLTSDTGVLGDNITNVNKPIFSGKADPEANVKLVFGARVFNVQADAEGNWSINAKNTGFPGETFPDGVYAYTIEAVDTEGNLAMDAEGNISILSGNVTIDTITNITARLDANSDTGKLANDGITKTISPVISGEAESGATLVLTLNSKTYSTTANSAGIWSINVEPDVLADGVYSYTVVSTDIADNTAQVTKQLTIDTTEPSTFTGRLRASDDSGISDSDTITNKTEPTFTGTGENGAEVKLVIDDKVYTTLVAASTWSIMTDAITQGVKTYTLSQTDVAGNVFTLPSASITIDTTTFLTGGLNVNSDLGLFNNDGVTKDNTPTFSGTAETGAKVVLEIGGQTHEMTVTDGTWSLTATNLTDGAKPYTITTTDKAGNVQTNTGSITVDTQAPTVFTGRLTVSNDNDTGIQNDDGITYNTAPNFSGTGENGAEVKLVIDGQTFTTTVANNSWSITTGILTPGVKNYTLTQTDIAGNEGSPLSGSMTIDTSTTATGVLASTSDTGRSASDRITKDNTPTFNGTGEEGAKILLSIDNKDFHADVVNGVWSITTTALGDGLKSYTITSTDIAGNIHTINGSIKVDTLAPAPFTGRLDASSDTGVSNDDTITRDATPTFTGTGEEGAEVKLEIAGQTLTTFVENGVWSITTATISQGNQPYTLTQIDAAGNIGTPLTGSITVDTTTSVTTQLDSASDTGKSNSDRITKINTPTIKGTGENDAVIVLAIDNKTFETVVANGEWEISTTALSEGNKAYTVTATDKAGNIASVTNSVFIDTVIPSPFTGGLLAADDTGSSNQDNITKVLAPRFTGTGENGSEVKLVIAGTTFTTTVEGGVWTIPTTAFTPGVRTYTITQTDVAGNSSSVISGNLVIDTENPISGGLAVASDSGFSNNDKITNDNTPTFSGTGEDNAIVTLQIAGQTLSTVVANGTWAITTTALTDGVKDYTITSVDTAGNLSSLTGSITVDTTTPLTGNLATASDTGLSNSDKITKDTMPTFTGTGENGAKVKLVIDGQEFETTVASNAWTITTTSLADGVNKPYSIIATDIAGNTNTVTGNITIDTQTPANLTARLSASSDSGSSTSDRITNDNTPTFNGTGEVGARISFSIVNNSTGITKSGTAVVGSDGNWSLDLTPILGATPLADGNYTATVNQSDAAGNEATAVTIPLTIDTVTTLTGTLMTDSDTGKSTTDKITSDTTPTFSGTGENGATVTLTIAGQTKTATIAAGVWSITTDAIATDGEKPYTIKSVDIAGNEQTLTGSITLDTAAPTVFSGALTAVTDTGKSTSDGITKVTTPVFTGTGENGAEVKLVIAGQTKTATVAGGVWSITTDTLAQGVHAYTLTQTDDAGNFNSLSGGITVDTTAPTPFTGALEAASDTGSSSTDRITKVTTPTFSGTGEDGAEVMLVIAGQTLTTTVAGNAWSITTAALTQGAKSYTLTSTDTAGNVVSLPASSITVDTETAITVALAAGEDTGSSSTDTITKINTPTFSGNGEAGASIVLLIGGKSYTSTVLANGTWSIKATDPLNEGQHNYTVSVTDIAGNTNTASGSVTIDTLVPSNLTGGLSTASDSGSSTSDGITKVTTPSFTGTGENGATVKLVIDGQTLTQVVSNGQWIITTATLTQGVKSYTLSQTDIAGNVFTLPVGSITVDTSTTVSGGLSAVSDSGASNSDRITNVTRPQFNGTTEVGNTVTLQIGGVTYNANVAADGSWTANVTNALTPDGVKSYIITATDIAGNTATSTGNITVDTAPPTPLTANLAAASDSGTYNNDGITNVLKPTFTGMAESNASIILTINGHNYTGTANASGIWSVTVNNNLTANMAHNYTVLAKDEAGNESQVTGNIYVDTTAPTPFTGGLHPDDDSGIAADNKTKVTAPRFTGTGENGAEVKLVIDGQTKTTIVSGGNWTINTDAMTAGTKSYTLTSTDVAGNTVTLPLGSITIDTSTFVTAILDQASDSGISQSDNITKVRTPTFVGTAEPGATVILSIATHTYNAVVQANGNWTANVTNSLPEGNVPYTVIATDIVGNTAQATGNIIVDTTPPSAPTGGLILASDTGEVGDGITKLATPTFAGTAEADATIELVIGGNTYTTMADGSGNWTRSVTNSLAEGTRSFSITATDKAGNVSAAFSGSITVDLTPPGINGLVLKQGATVIDPWLTNLNTTGLNIGGTTENGIQVKMTIATTGQQLSTVSHASTGVFNFANFPTDLAEGTHSISIEATDKAGNTSTTVKTIQIDRSVSLTATLEAQSDTGISSTDKITKDTTPIFTGTTDPNAVVTLKLNGVSYGTATADNLGVWSITTSELADASYTYVVSAVDPLGNNTNALGNNQSGTLVIDTVAPSVTGWLDLADDTGDQGDNVTTKQIVRFNGQSEPGATVKLYIDNKVFSAVVPSNGQYEITTTQLNYNVHNWNIIAADKAGNTNNVSGQITVQPDLIPLTVKIKDSDNTGSTSDMITSVKAPVIQGEGTPGANITVVIKNSANDTVGTFTAIPSAAGYWEVHVAPALSDGNYSLQVNSVKGVATDSVSRSLVIDTVNTLTQSVAGGQIVKATAVEIVGETDAGATVTVEINEASYSGRANASGNYTVAVPGLLEGAYSYAVTSVDVAGNIRTINSNIATGGGFTVDRTAPVITGRLVASSDTGISNSDGITQDNTPTFVGTISGNYNEVYLELNYVRYYIFREANPTATPPVTAVNNVAGDGSWTLTMPQLSDGYYNYRIYAKDAANNETAISNAIRVKTRIELSVSLEGDSGDLSTDFITNNTLMRFKGVTDPGNSIVAKLYSSSNLLLDTVSATPNGAGAYTVDFGARAVGTYKAVFDVSDLAGNTFSHTVDKVIIDTSVQNLTMALDSTSDTGEIKYFGNSVLTDGITKVKNPVLIGTGEGRSEVTVTIKNSANEIIRTLTTYVGESGNWSFSPGILADGAYSVSAVARDPAGNISSTPATYNIIIKSTQPALVWSIPADTNSDGIINATEYAASATPGRIGFTGTGDPGDKIVLTISGQEYVTNVATDGAWSITTPPLSDFLYNFQLQAWDKAGNVTTVNDSIILDSGITAGMWMVGEDDTLHQLDQVTNNTNPRWSVLTEKDNNLTFTVKRSDGSVFYTENLVAPANNFIWKLPTGMTYPDGYYTVTIVARDIANNTATSTSGFVIDTTVAQQANPNISYGYNGVKGMENGIYYTDHTQFTLTVPVSGEIPYLRITLPNGVSKTVYDKVNGNFVVQIPEALASGTGGVGQIHAVTLTYIDWAGNTIDKVIQVSVKSGIEPFTWVLNGFNKSSGIHYGKDGTANFSGTSEIGLTIRVTINGTSYTTLVDNSGNWTINVPNLTDGVYQMYVYVSDRWGNERWSGDQVMVVDSFAPNYTYAAAADKDSSDHILWNDQSGNLTGRVEPGSIFTIKLDAGNEEVLTLDAAGNWSKTFSALTEGTHRLVMKAVDKAGNETVKTVDLVVDTQISLFDSGLTSATDTGMFNNDNITNNNKPTFEGTGEAGANITFSIAGQNYTTTVLPNGTWKVDIATAIADGTHTYNIMTTDAAGNSRSSSGNVTIDTQMPASLGLSLSQGQTSVSGNLSGEAGTQIQFLTANQMYSDTVDENGDWAITLPPLSYGQIINVNITDIAGNTRQEDYHI